jgi:hypothetical protein
MNNWQMPLVLMIVLAAGLYLARRAWRSLTGRKAGGCGDAVAPSRQCPTPMSED